MKKLVCDRCGLELTDKSDIELAFEGQEAWEVAVKVRGNEPRGVYPCKSYISCGGEMQVVEDKRGFWRRRQLVT
ncbi:hypothetical protein ACFLVW_06810 [Chloroflexota bacterium]